MALAAAIPYVIAASAAISAYGAIRQGQAAKGAAEFNATVNDQNAQLARQEAQMLAREQDKENYLRLGAVRAAAGKSGGTQEGSVLDVIGMVAAQGEEERQMHLYRGELKARGFQNTGTLDRFSGAQAQQASYFKAGSELLGGGADAYTANRRLKRGG